MDFYLAHLARPFKIVIVVLVLNVLSVKMGMKLCLTKHVKISLLSVEAINQNQLQFSIQVISVAGIVH